MLAKFRFYVGYSKLCNKDYEKSISIFSDCIKMNLNMPVVYWYRGRAYYSNSEMQNAINDYKQFILIEPEYWDGYTALGACYDEIEDWEKAIENYNRAIGLNEDAVEAYLFKAMIYDRQFDLKSAFDVLEKANTKTLLKGRNQVYFQLIKITLKKDISYGVALFKVVDFFMNIGTLMNAFEIDIESRNKAISLVIEEALPFLISFRELAKDTLDIWPNANEEESKKMVSHYTNLYVADKLVMTDDLIESEDSDATFGRLRYSNTAFLNDPQEGRIVFDYFKDSGIGSTQDWEEILDVFDKELIENSNFYIGSFLPVDSSHEDDLVMWRTYGKDHLQNEAGGCSLIIDTKFFDKHAKSPIPIQVQVRKDIINYSQFEVGQNQPLFRVFYYSKTSKRFFNVSSTQISYQNLDDEIRKINEKDETIKKYMEGIGKAVIKIKKMEFLDKDGKVINKDVNNAVIQYLLSELVIQYLLSELRFFFKSADYSYENELRVIINGVGRNVEIDKGDTLPRKTYVESKRAVKPYLRKVVLGPKVPHPDRWIYLDTQMKRDYPNNPFELIKSKCNFQ